MSLFLVTVIFKLHLRFLFETGSYVVQVGHETQYIVEDDPKLLLLLPLPLKYWDYRCVHQFCFILTQDLIICLRASLGLSM